MKLSGSELPKSSKVIARKKIKKGGFFFPVDSVNFMIENQQVKGLINIIIIKL